MRQEPQLILETKMKLRTTTRTSTTSWRETVMEAGFVAEADGGSSMDAMLQAIRRCKPACSTLLLWPDRHQLMRFMNRRPGGARSLVAGANAHIDRNRFCPYYGWFGFSFEDTWFEAAFTPTTYFEGCVIIIAATQSDLERLNKALSDYDQHPEGRSLKYARRWKPAPELDAELGKVTWDDVILAPEIIQGVRSIVEGFIDQRASFEALGFPWRRGVLLIGPPGTGKTMLCKASAAALPQLPFLYVRDFDIDNDRNKDDAIATIFRRARKLSPCMLVFEDIDGLVNDYNRTTFLNELDGFENNNGLLVMASSNHPEKIDSALLKRPSRFDRVFHVGLPAERERATYCLRMLNAPAIKERLSPGFDIEGLATAVAKRTAGFTPAYLKEAFLSAGVQMAQEGESELGERYARAVLAQAGELKSGMRKINKGDVYTETATDDVRCIGILRNRAKDA